MSQSQSLSSLLSQCRVEVDVKEETLSILSDGCSELEGQLTLTLIPFTVMDGVNVSRRFVFHGTNALDLLSHFPSSMRSTTFSSLLAARSAAVPRMRVVRMDDNAVMPYKSRFSDVGYDLTLIRVHKRVSDVVTLYDTGVRIHVSDGYYAEIVPRSSIIKSGYMLANNTGVIDRSYDGNLYVAVVRVDPNAAELPLPFRGFQLILRPQVYAEVEEVHADELVTTTRGAGGFGSTG
jgi:deoxyuridine 5'-triphosphate nucleotidohydrolase